MIVKTGDLRLRPIRKGTDWVGTYSVGSFSYGIDVDIVNDFCKVSYPEPWTMLLYCGGIGEGGYNGLRQKIHDYLSEYKGVGITGRMSAKSFSKLALTVWHQRPRNWDSWSYNDDENSLPGDWMPLLEEFERKWTVRKGVNQIEMKALIPDSAIDLIVYESSGKNDILYIVAKNLVLIPQAKWFEVTFNNHTAYDQFFTWLYYAMKSKYNLPKLAPKKEDKKTWPENPKIKLGADPELGLFYLDKDRLPRLIEPLNAGDFFSGALPGNEVGFDGFSGIFEIRPKPNEDPTEVTNYVGKCVRILCNAISNNSKGKEFFLEAGGGFYYPIGGHIHVGAPFIKELLTEDVANYFGRMMDNFVYFPMRDRMPGAIREWGKVSIDGKVNNTRARENKEDFYHFVGKKVKKWRRNCGSSGYDIPTAFREQPHGIEYRSLPSFIADRGLTECVFTISKCCMELLYKTLRTGNGIEYNVPVKKHDYMKFIPEDIYHKFMRYINGDKREVFLRNVADNWGYNLTPLECYISMERFLPKLESLDLSDAASKSLGPLLKEIVDKFGYPKNLEHRYRIVFSETPSSHKRLTILCNNAYWGTKPNLDMEYSLEKMEKKCCVVYANMLEPDDIPGISRIAVLCLMVSMAKNIEHIKEINSIIGRLKQIMPQCNAKFPINLDDIIVKHIGEA